MTEPDVASSRDEHPGQDRAGRRQYVASRRKWWSPGRELTLHKIAIFMGKTDPEAKRHEQQSRSWCLWTPGASIERTLSVFGYGRPADAEISAATW